MTNPITRTELAALRLECKVTINHADVWLSDVKWPIRAERLLNEIDRLHAVIERMQAARFDPDVAREEDEILAATGGGWHDFERKTDG